MFERILLPLDGSELSEMALPYVEELASKLKSEVILYHVQGHENAHLEHMHQIYLERLAENVRKNILKGKPQETEVRVTAKIEDGTPTENICNLVKSNNVDLIIMTAVSTSGLKVGKMIGSVSDQVCRTVPIPVMLLRPQAFKQIEDKKQLINRILLPVDGSELSKQALPVGEELASKLRINITLFQMANITRFYDDGSGATAYMDFAKLDENEKIRVSAEMTVLEKQLKGKDLDVSNIVTSGFDAAYEIIELCKKTDIGLIVMSTHGRSGLGRWIFGSVAEKVLHYGEVPILLVNTRAT